MDKHYLSANQYQSDMWRLASVIRKSGWKPDFLVGLWRGGAPVAIAVHEYFRATGWNVQHIPLKCSSYTGIGANNNKVAFLLGDAIFGMFRAGDKVLFVDDVFDTGKTAAAVHARMQAVGADSRIACVYWKPAKNRTRLVPDYVARDIGNDWIVFPHEIEGLAPAEVREKDPVLAELVEAVAQAACAR